MGIRIINDEPGRKIEMLESMVPSDDGKVQQFVYHARCNGGEWLSLRSHGNRIPSGW